MIRKVTAKRNEVVSFVLFADESPTACHEATMRRISWRLHGRRRMGSDRRGYAVTPWRARMAAMA
jgi:hypothetical protein